MTALIENYERRVRNLFLKSLAIGQRYQAILSTRKDHCRLLDCLRAIVEEVFAPNDRLDNALDRVTIARANTFRQYLIDNSVGDKRFVIENLSYQQLHILPG